MKEGNNSLLVRTFRRRRSCPYVNVICECKVKCFVEKVLADGWVEFLDVEEIKLRYLD